MTKQSLPTPRLRPGDSLVGSGVHFRPPVNQEKKLEPLD